MSALQKSWDVLKLQGEAVAQPSTNIYGDSTGGGVDPNSSGNSGTAGASDADKQKKKEDKAQAWLDDEELMRIIGGLKPDADAWVKRVESAQGMLPIEAVREDKHKQHAKLLDSAADGAQSVLSFLQNASPKAMGVSHSLGDEYGSTYGHEDDDDSPLWFGE